MIAQHLSKLCVVADPIVPSFHRLRHSVENHVGFVLVQVIDVVFMEKMTRHTGTDEGL
jgi:hypothetical protein